MEHFDRGERRYQIARLKTKRQWYYGQGRVRGTEGITPMTPRQLGRVVQYPANCSCWMCGNDRKDHGLTFQELRIYQDLKEDLMSETQENKRKAYEEGRNAYCDGDHDVDSGNPHPVGTELNDKWREGYLQAERDDPLADMVASRTDIDDEDED